MKMEAPKLDTIRFNESDVIVASDIPDVFTTSVFGFNNEVAGDAFVIYNGVTYTEAASLNAALAEDGLAGLFQLYVPGRETHSYFDSGDMYYIDKAYDPDVETSILIPDGVYTWNGNYFVHQ